MAAEVIEVGQEVSEDAGVNNNFISNSNPGSQTTVLQQPQPLLEHPHSHNHSRSRKVKKHKSKNHIHPQSPTRDKHENCNESPSPRTRTQKPSSRERESQRHERFWDIEATTTLDQLKEKIGHKQRLRDGLSELHIVVQPVEVFASVYPEFSDTFTREQLRSLEKEFFTVDLDQDGHLNNIEIKYWMEKYQQPINQRKVRSIFSTFDGDKDGKLSFREFLLLCQHLGYEGCEGGHFDSNLNNEALGAYKKENVETVENRNQPRPRSAHRSKSRDKRHHYQHQHHHPQQKVEHKNKPHVDCENEKQSRSKYARSIVQKQEINGENTGIRSTSRAKGKIKPVVDYFEEKIAEVSTDFKKSSELDDDLKERKTRSKNPEMRNMPEKNAEGQRQIQIHQQDQDETHLKVVEPLIKIERDCTSCSSRFIPGNSNYRPSPAVKDFQEKAFSNATVIPVPPPLPPVSDSDHELKKTKTVNIKLEPTSQNVDEEDSNEKEEENSNIIPIPPPMPQFNSSELDEFHVLSKSASSRTVTQVNSQTTANPNSNHLQSKTKLTSQSRSNIDQDNNNESSQTKIEIKKSDGDPDTQKEKENDNQVQSETGSRTNLTNPNSNMSLRLHEIFTKKDEAVIPEFRTFNRTPKGFVPRAPEKD